MRHVQSLGASHSQGPAILPVQVEPRSETSSTPVTAIVLNVEAYSVMPPLAAVAAVPVANPLPPPPPPPPLARDDLLHVIARKLGIPIDHGQVHHNKPIT